jgi:hypothetical protein
MASFNRYDVFSENLSKGVHNLNANALKVLLSNAAPNATTHALRSDTTELSTGGGYTSGGAATTNSTSRSGAVTSIVGVDITFTATGALGPFRYAVLYDDTPTSPLDPLIGWWDYGSSITLALNEQFVVDFGASMFTVG